MMTQAPQIKLPAPFIKNHQQCLLFIDDSTLVLETLQALLEEESCEVLMSDTVLQALLLVARHYPQYIFIDADMPELSGFHLCALLKENLRYKAVRIVLLLSQESLPLRARALSVGADAVITKPFGKAELRPFIQLSGGQAA